MSVPTQVQFTSEVKADRLKTLWRATLILSIVIGWIVLNIAMIERVDVARLVVPFVILTVGSLLTRQLLIHVGFSTAAWAFALAGVVAIGIALLLGDELVREIVPFAFPIIVFVMGLLLQPANTLLIAMLAALTTIFAPALVVGNFDSFGTYQIAAIILTFLSALLAMQVTGDLSQVSEWALLNYQRERRVASELFDNRQQLELSLARSRALGERLQDTNVELDHARATAEEAKHFRGQFLANMSHELRTPLNAIIGFSETMLKFPAMYDGIKLPSAYEDDLAQIYTSGRQLLNLINDILDLSKVDAGKLEIRIGRVDLKPLINATSSTAAGLIGQKQLKLEIDLPDFIPPVLADEARVRQVLLNLYSNAAKFTDRGAIRLSLQVVEAGVQISLRDSGVGIPADSLELIFEEFKQAETGIRDPRSGAGLGLAISRQLLTLMGGRIWAESEMGKGSTFHFVLPIFVEAASNVRVDEPDISALDMMNVSATQQQTIG